MQVEIIFYDIFVSLICYWLHNDGWSHIVHVCCTMSILSYLNPMFLNFCWFPQCQIGNCLQVHKLHKVVYFWKVLNTGKCYRFCFFFSAFLWNSRELAGEQYTQCSVYTVVWTVHTSAPSIGLEIISCDRCTLCIRLGPPVSAIRNLVFNSG